jgi:hypothetical protein
LNFQALALVPALIVVGFGIRFTSRIVFKRKSNKLLFESIKKQLRNVERLLNVSTSEYEISKKIYASRMQSLKDLKSHQNFDELSLQDFGRLILSLSRLKTLAEGKDHYILHLEYSINNKYI